MPVRNNMSDRVSSGECEWNSLNIISHIGIDSTDSAHNNLALLYKKEKKEILG